LAARLFTIGELGDRLRPPCSAEKLVTEIWRRSAAELAQLIRARKISAREAADAALQRLDAVNPLINAVVDHRPDLVRNQADAIDRAIAKGEDPGLLAGVPMTVKVNIDQAGFATTNGTKLQRDLVAKTNSPVVDNLLAAGAVIVGRTNAPAFSLRWFTTNIMHGDTKNPRNPSLTPGGSSGGAAAAVAAGIGHLAHGTDIGGSIRYPAYACGIHGLRPTHGRVPAYNASSPERAIGAQLMAVSGPIGRTIADLRLGFTAMTAPDSRDPWFTPVPLVGPALPLRAAVCLRPGGLPIVPEVESALLDAGKRLEKAGWTVEQIDDVPFPHEVGDLQEQLWLADGFATLAEAAQREGDPGALAVVAAYRSKAENLAPDLVARALVKRATLLRQWLQFLDRYPILVLPVSAELPFPDGLDLQGEAGFLRVWKAQLVQRVIPVMGLPSVVVSTGVTGATTVGVEIVGNRYREDMCLQAAEAIEAGGVPPAPIDPTHYLDRR
jgi:amidase